jgi:hypothetical protein
MMPSEIMLKDYHCVPNEPQDEIEEEEIYIGDED